MAMKTRFCLLLLVMSCTLLPVAPASAGTRMNKTEALQLAFVEGAQVETLSLFLTDRELDRVEALCGQRPDSALYSFYAGRVHGAVSGYAAIEAVTVRTHPATVLVVLEPQGRVRFIEVLAFFEPEEYLPSRRWLDQFNQQPLSTQLRVGGAIQGISGATLSAQALTRQARKVAALLQVYLERGA